MNLEQPSLTQRITPGARRLLSLVEARQVLGGLSRSTLQRRIEDGQVRTVRLGRRVFVSTDEIERIIEAGVPGGTGTDRP